MNDNAVRLQNIFFSWDNLADHGENRKDKAYSKSKFQLRIDELLVKKREKVFLYGPSGSGKSTLLGLICGTIKPRSGQVLVNEKCLGDMRGSQVDRYRSDNIGVIFQMFNLLSYISAMENVLLPLEFSENRRHATGANPGERRKEACRLLKQLELGGDREGNANPIDLSVGQQQRVAAARAMIGGPGLIIADEPTSALDEDRQERFLELLFSEIERSKASLLMVSHNRRLEHHFDRTISLENELTG